MIGTLFEVSWLAGIWFFFGIAGAHLLYLAAEDSGSESQQPLWMCIAGPVLFAIAIILVVLHEVRKPA
jgi:hypothetical protein